MVPVGPQDSGGRIEGDQDAFRPPLNVRGHVCVVARIRQYVDPVPSVVEVTPENNEGSRTIRCCLQLLLPV